DRGVVRQDAEDTIGAVTPSVRRLSGLRLVVVRWLLSGVLILCVRSRRDGRSRLLSWRGLHGPQRKPYGGPDGHLGVLRLCRKGGLRAWVLCVLCAFRGVSDSIRFELI